MVASSTLLDRAFVEVKRLTYAGLDPAGLLEAVTTRLQRVVPFEAYCATANDPVSGLLTRLDSGGAIGEREHQQYLEHIYFAEDLDAQRQMVQQRVRVALLSEVTGGHLEHALRYREVTGPLGLGYELLGLCT